MSTTQSLQMQHAPSTRCFGCGPANERGLRLQSYVEGDETVAHWMAELHHEAFPGMLSGGITGTLLDCHSNWTAAWHLMVRDGLERPPCTVTAEYAVKLRRPTPSRTGSLQLRARVVSSEGSRVLVEASLTAEGKVCATCTGTFVAVQEGHPAFNRWS